MNENFILEDNFPRGFCFYTIGLSASTVQEYSTMPMKGLYSSRVQYSANERPLQFKSTVQCQCSLDKKEESI
jgi:hypothetical protein